MGCVLCSKPLVLWHALCFIFFHRLSRARNASRALKERHGPLFCCLGWNKNNSELRLLLVISATGGQRCLGGFQSNRTVLSAARPHSWRSWWHFLHSFQTTNSVYCGSPRASLASLHLMCIIIERKKTTSNYAGCEDKLQSQLMRTRLSPWNRSRSAVCTHFPEGLVWLPLMCCRFQVTACLRSSPLLKLF